jgi:hypothetical protein
LERTRSLMDGAVRDCLVTGYAALVPSLTLPDPDDRHILAAAIHAEAGLIVTFNLVDFPPQALAPYGVYVRHPDELFAELLDAAVDEFCEAARLQRHGLKNPSRSVEEFLATLEAVGLAKTVARLQAYADRL